MKDKNQNGIKETGARERLLEAGIALFAVKGYAGSSVREIVSLAGVSKPVLYYYFQNKEGIFRAILDWAAKQQETLLRRVLEKPGTAYERFLELYRRIYEGVVENPNLFKMIHNLVLATPDGVPDCDLERYHRRLLETIKTIYREGLTLNEIKEHDPEEVGMFLTSLIQFCLNLDHVHPDGMDPGRPGRLLRLAFQGLNRKETDK